MLPTTSTNRYGDLLKEFYEGVKNNNLSEPRADELKRVFNELWDRENKYHSWLGIAGAPILRSPTIFNPNWQSSPLHAYTMYMQNDLTVANDTDKYIQHDAARGFGTVFETFIADANGTRVKRGATEFSNVYMPFRVDGFAIWTANATGYRVAYIESYDKDDNFLARSPLHTIKGFSEIDNVCPFAFTWFYTDKTDYVKFKVHQTSGGNLVLKEFYAAFSLA